jgi:hypothetical protein
MTAPLSLGRHSIPASISLDAPAPVLVGVGGNVWFQRESFAELWLTLRAAIDWPKLEALLRD